MLLPTLLMVTGVHIRNCRDCCLEMSYVTPGSKHVSCWSNAFNFAKVRVDDSSGRASCLSALSIPSAGDV